MTVPAVLTVPLTLAPATALAVVANATAPVTLAPVIELKLDPLPLTLVKIPCVAPKLPTFALPDALNVVANTPVTPKLPTLALPDTDKLVNVPTEVICV